MKLKITVTPLKFDNFCGYANVTFDDTYALENIRIYEGKNNNQYIKLPSYSAIVKDENGVPKKDDKGNNVLEYKNVFHPITVEAQKELSTAIIEEYKATVKADKNSRKHGGEYNIKGSMQITRAVATPFEREDENIKGFATVWYGDFALEKIKIKESENGLYLSLPSYSRQVKDKDGNKLVDDKGNNVLEYKDVFHPITAEAHSKLKDAVLTDYNNKTNIIDLTDEDELGLSR